jgi:transcriptional regulator with XRE-family HTH domain
MTPTDNDPPTRDMEIPPAENSLGQALAERLRTEREYLGLSQDQVARALELPRAAVSAYETGRRKVSSVELARLAALYGTTPNRLLGSDVPVDDRTTQLFRATNKLSDHDKDQVLRFVEFLSNTPTGSPQPDGSQ